MPNKFTPGPWIQQANCKAGLHYFVIKSETENREVITIINPDLEEQTIQEYNANASLIASAPDLLAALESFVAWIDVNKMEGINLPSDLERIYSAGCKAIAKAREGASLYRKQ